MTFLRLFPLRLVLFPGQPVALQVFEPRYLALVEECLESGEPFGIALIEDGPEVGGAATPHLVGTTATIEEILPLGDGRLALSARGGRRFRIAELLHDHPYLAAEVEYPVDEVADVPEPLQEQIARNFEQLLRLQHTIHGSWARDVPVPAAAGALADAIGANGLDFGETDRLQTLLETLDVRRRLERAGDLLTSLLEDTHRRAAAAVAERWGSLESNN
ncbi:MAG: LON peptidase substrate-binding domain-containing protein [Dehalococcoidia bacterium]